MNNVLFSILVPVYNVKSYICEALNSILAQKSNDYEVILIDDGSTDGSGIICDEYHNAYPHVFFVVHKKNEGLISARREAIQRAKGKYSIFLDSDDMLEKDCLNKLRQIINAESDLDMVIYGFNYLYMDTQKKIPGATLFKDGDVFKEDKERLYRQLLYSTKLNNLVIKCIKTELLQNDPTDYSKYYRNPFGEDLLQSLYPITYAKKIIYTTAKLYIYRIHNSSMVHRFDSDKMKMHFEHDWDELLRRYMYEWGCDSELDYSLRDACLYKNMVDTIAFCWLDKSNDRKAILAFVSQQLESEKSRLLLLARTKELSLTWRIALNLYAHEHLNILGAYYRLLKIAVALRDRGQK